MMLTQKFKDKKILITGASGLIGSNLLRKLLQLGAEVWGAGRNLHKLEVTFTDLKNNKHLHLIQFDPTSCTSAELPSFDYIYHAAGSAERDQIYQYPVDVIKANIIGLFKILDYVRRRSLSITRVFIFSSVTVYNSANLIADKSVNEMESGNFTRIEDLYNVYSDSKRMTEIIALSYWRQYNMNIVIGRFSTVYGPASNLQASAFYSFIENIRSNKDIEIKALNLPRRDNIYVEDAVNGILYVSAFGNSGEAYNISSNGEGDNFKALSEIAATLINNSSSKSKLIIPNGFNVTPGLKLDNSKLKSIGWKITTDIINGCRETLNYYALL